MYLYMFLIAYIKNWSSIIDLMLYPEKEFSLQLVMQKCKVQWMEKNSPYRMLNRKKMISSSPPYRHESNLTLQSHFLTSHFRCLSIQLPLPIYHPPSLQLSNGSLVPPILYLAT